MTERIINIGLLGASWIAPDAIIKPSRQLPESVLIYSVAARDRNRAEQYARRHEIPVVHNSYEDLLNDPKVDAVYIALPNSHHCEWSIKALNAGKHVLCEKPLASNAQEALQMHNTAKETELVLMEAFHYRYHPLMQRVDQIIQSGELGTVKHVEAELQFPVFRGSDIRYNYSLAGGALMDCGTYPINLIRHVLGEEPTVVSAETKLAYPNVDQTTTAQFKTDSGSTAKITCSLFKIIPSVYMSITGSNGVKLSVTNWVAPQLLYNKLSVSGHTEDTTKNRSETFPKDKSTYYYQLQAFVNAVKGTGTVLTDTEDAVKNQQLIDSIYQKLNLPLRGTKLDQ
jgi:predicted dehydrogenase